MARRVVSLLLVPLLLLSQWSAHGHTHAGTGVVEPHDHAHTPHVHLVLHSSHRHPGDDRHHHSGDADEHDECLECHTPGGDDHDDDAFYLPTSIAVASRSDGAACVSTGTPVSAVPAFDHGYSAPDACPSLYRPPPNPPGHRCPLYLRTLALLI